MSNIVDLNARHPLAGTWKCGDGFSDIEITVAFLTDKPTVSILDKYDGEIPEIFEVKWEPERSVLSFSTHWSTGRLVKYQFTPSPKLGRVGVTFSYTDHEVWERV
jgi:uncharacterized protein with WD repeat